MTALADVGAADPKTQASRTQVRLGLVGAGAVARLHFSALQRLAGQFELVAVADPDLERAHRLADPVGAASHADHLAMARSESLDAAIVASPDPAHHRQVVDLMERGIAVLVEKPMARTVDECMDMAMASTALQVPLVVGHVQRYLPSVASAIRMVREGAIGDVRLVVDRISSRYEPDTRGTWFLDPSMAPHGILANLGCHIIDRLFLISGSSHIAVNDAWLDGQHVPTEATATLSMADGVVGVLLLTGTGFPTAETTEIVGTTGALRLSTAYGLQRFSRGEVTHEEPAESDDDVKAFAAQLRDFHRAVAGAPPQVDAAYGTAVMSTIERIAAVAAGA